MKSPVVHPASWVGCCCHTIFVLFFNQQITVVANKQTTANKPVNGFVWLQTVGPLNVCECARLAGGVNSLVTHTYTPASTHTHTHTEWLTGQHSLLYQSVGRQGLMGPLNHERGYGGITDKHTNTHTHTHTHTHTLTCKSTGRHMHMHFFSCSSKIMWHPVLSLSLMCLFLRSSLNVYKTLT